MSFGRLLVLMKHFPIIFIEMYCTWLILISHSIISILVIYFPDKDAVIKLKIFDALEIN